MGRVAACPLLLANATTLTHSAAQQQLTRKNKDDNNILRFLFDSLVATKNTVSLVPLRPAGVSEGTGCTQSSLSQYIHE
jgi:hypothetical protein